MSERVQEALINLFSALCGAFIGGLSGFLAVVYTNWRDRQRRREERSIERTAHNTQKIEDYLDARISIIKSLANPPININTLIEYLQAELWKDAGSSEAARASARLLGDKELATHLAELENMFLTIWDTRQQLVEERDLPEMEKIAIDIYHKCAQRVEALKKATGNM